MDESDIEQILNRFDQIDARFDGMDVRFDGMDARFDRVDRTLAQLAKGQETLGLLVNAIHSRVVKLEDPTF